MVKCVDDQMKDYMRNESTACAIVAIQVVMVALGYHLRQMLAIS